MESACEISAMPEATVISLPYELGMTIVFSPNGIANDATAQTTTLSSGHIWKMRATARNSSRKTIRRNRLIQLSVFNGLVQSRDCFSFCLRVEFVLPSAVA